MKVPRFVNGDALSQFGRSGQLSQTTFFTSSATRSKTFLEFEIAQGWDDASQSKNSHDTI